MNEPYKPVPMDEINKRAEILREEEVEFKVMTQTEIDARADELRAALATETAKIRRPARPVTREERDACAAQMFDPKFMPQEEIDEQAKKLHAKILKANESRRLPEGWERASEAVGIDLSTVALKNDGGSTPHQYGLPPEATELQDLIEYREMNFAMGNIFKACYRADTCSHSTRQRDLRKIIWFAQRELARCD
jgi:hypothetical protein